MLDESMLIEKGYVITNNKSHVNLYRRKILPYIDQFKGLIEKGNGESLIKMREIRNILGWEEYKDRSDNGIYSRIQTILLEFGIKVTMYHSYGCNLVMTFADEKDIISETDAVRIRQEKVAKGKGFLNYAEYNKHKPYYMKSHIHMTNEDSSRYLSYIGKKFVSGLFPGCVINEHSWGNQHLKESGYDWTTKDGKKVKIVSSSLRHRIDEDCFEREYFEWNISHNSIADIFILVGWGDRTDLDLMKAWIFNKKDIVNRKEFWNRSSFLISTHDRSIAKYSKFEVNDNRLETIRERIEQKDGKIVLKTVNKMLEVLEWYKVYFR